MTWAGIASIAIGVAILVYLGFQALAGRITPGRAVRDAPTGLGTVAIGLNLIYDSDVWLWSGVVLILLGVYFFARRRRAENA